MELFNNREVATFIWLLLFSVLALWSVPIRRSVLHVLRALLHWKILLFFGLMALYTVAVVVVLHLFALWNNTLLKDTVVWFFFAGMVTAFDFVTSGTSGAVFRKVVLDNLKVALVLEFLVNTYTLSLSGELILIPVLTLIAALDAVARSKAEYIRVSKITGALLIITGAGLLASAVLQAISNYKNLQSWDTVRSLLLAPVLSILLSPLIYLILLFANYEVLFSKLDIGPPKEPSLKRYAKRRLLTHLRCSLRRLRGFIESHSFELVAVRNRDDIDKLLRPEGQINPSSTNASR